MAEASGPVTAGTQAGVATGSIGHAHEGRQSAGNRTLASVQVLRAVAALMVVFHHYVGTSVERGFAFAGLAGAAVGNAGVDIFFVISGFIMEYTAGARPSRDGARADFLARRVIRIIPLYWTLTLLAYGASVALKGVIHSRPSFEQFLLSLVLLPGTSLGGNTGYVIPMAWTLAYEFWFYAVFACLLGIAVRRRLAILAVAFTAASALGVALAPSNPVLGIMTNPLLLEFLAGCLLAAWVRAGGSLPRPVAVLLIVAATAAFALVFRRDTNDSLVRLLIWGVPAALLVAGAVLMPQGQDGRRPAAWPVRAMAHVGDISYSLYLSHFFVIALFVKLHGLVAARWGSSPWLAAAGLFALCLLVAELSYRLIEQPSRAGLLRWYEGRRRRAGAAAVAAAS